MFVSRNKIEVPNGLKYFINYFINLVNSKIKYIDFSHNALGADVIPTIQPLF